MSTPKQIAKAEYMREYTTKNQERINAQRRARRTEATLERERVWRKANPDLIRDYKKRDREKRPADYQRWKRDWCARHASAIRERKAVEYRTNKAAINARLTAFRENNKERYRQTQQDSLQRRRARMANAPVIEKINRMAIYERDKGICGLCHKKVKLKDFSLDHIVPISLGGSHIPSNVQTAHLDCNRRRNNKGPAQLRIF